MFKSTVKVFMAAMACAAALGAQALEADPPQVLINSLNSVVVIKLSDGGTPLSAKDFKGSRFMVDDSNYAHMVKVSGVAGGVRVEPTATFEVGSYDLVIDTTKGSITVPVNAPLSGEAGVLEKQTEALGGDKGEAMKDLGLTTPLPRGAAKYQSSVTLADQYTVGQSAPLPVPEVPGATLRWVVNGVALEKEAGASDYLYVFPAEGDYTLQLQERAGNGAWETVSTSTVLAVEETPVTMNAVRGQFITFNAPDGYSKYTWTLEGATVAEGLKAKLRFPNPGTHVLSVRCEGPAVGPANTFRVARYEVTVP